MSKLIVEYRMIIHLFAASSSPGCANFGLKRAADDGEAEFGEDAANYIRNNFYMDDGLTSVASVEQAVSLIERSRALCATAGLRLHKFISNKRDILQRMPESERAKSLKEVDLRVDPLPLEKVLGIIWCIEMDVFNFHIELRDGPLMRRGMLSTISSIFDPVGFLAPVLLEGKRILQDLFKENASWDDLVPDHLGIRWRNWRQDLSNLDNFEVQRCLKPDTFGVTEKIELHHFFDASETGYGECSYIRIINQLGKIHCSFVMGKARVAPLKHVSVPRLELTAKISAFLERELKYESITHYYWVDSKVVIAYIQNEAKFYF